MKNLNLPYEKSFIGPALLWKRILAFIIDMSIINFFVFYPFNRIVDKIVPQQSSISETFNYLMNTNIGLMTVISFAMSFLVISYFIVLELGMSQSIGKRILNIYVASDANQLTFLQALTRNIIFIPVFPFALLLIIDPLFMFFTKSNQRLTEILSRTRVVEKYNL